MTEFLQTALAVLTLALSVLVSVYALKIGISLLPALRWGDEDAGRSQGPATLAPGDPLPVGPDGKKMELPEGLTSEDPEAHEYLWAKEVVADMHAYSEAERSEAMSIIDRYSGESP